MPYDDAADDTARQDFKRLWATSFLDDISIEASDYTFANGVVGKLITYHLEERPRVKQVSYRGSKAIERSKIDEQLRDKRLDLRLDSFLDERTLSRIDSVVRTMMGDKGFAGATVAHTVTPVAGGPKLVSVTFTIEEGPNLAIRDVEFIGNHAVSDKTLSRVMKANREQTLLSVLKGGGHYKETAFAEDAQNVEDYYRDHGYIQARVGQADVRTLDDSPDGHTRWVQLRIPLVEGTRYRLGSVRFEGNHLIPTETLRTLFSLREGEWYSQAQVRKGLDKARELYGAAG